MSETPQTGFGFSILRFGTSRPGPNIIRFDRKTEARFFMCRRCRNHVVTEDNYLFNMNVIICQDPVNVRADDIEQRWLLHRQPVVSVSYNACDKNLGQKLGMVETPNRVIQEGRLYFIGIEFCIGKEPGRFMLTQKSQLMITESQERKSTEEFK